MKGFVNFCLRKPVTTLVMQIFIIVFGLLALSQLTIREYPDVSEAVISVSTRFPGANSDIVESQVTQLLEDQLASVQGLNHLFSTSQFGSSSLNLLFESEYSIETAINDVRDKISSVLDMLPDGSKPPVISKASSDAHPVIWLSITSEQYDLMGITEIFKKTIKDDLALLPGVARLRLGGDREQAIRIVVDPHLLNSYQISIQQLTEALHRENVTMASGELENNLRKYVLITESQLSTPEAFEQMIISASGPALVRLGDVAKIKIGPKFDDSLTRYNGQSAIAIGLVKQSDANPLTLAARLQAKIPALQAKLPATMKLQVAFDTTKPISASLKAVNHTLIEAILCVLLVVMLFLGRFRAAIIPLMTIPISLLGACLLMQALGYSLNLLTLLAMVLAIGLVVDDAIVVVENYYHHRMGGKDSLCAIKDSMAEISHALVAMTLTLAAVYLPLQFISGTLGRLLAEFAVVLAGSVIISGFVALSLSPLLCHAWLRNDDANHTWKITTKLEAMYEMYGRLLPRLLEHRRKIALAMLVIVGLLIGLVNTLPSEMVPDEDRNFFIAMGTSPPGSTIRYVEQYATQMEDMIAAQPEVENVFSIIGYPDSTQNISFVLLKDKSDRKAPVSEVTARLNAAFWAIPGTQSFAFSPPSELGSSSGHGQGAIQLNLQTTESYQKLYELSNQIVEKLRTDHPEILHPDTDLKMNKPEYKIKILRDKVAQSGLNATQVAQTLQWFFGETIVDYYPYQSEQHAIILQMPKRTEQTVNDLLNLPILTPNMGMSVLANYVDVTPHLAPTKLLHKNKHRATMLTADMGEDLTYGEALEIIEQVVSDVGAGKIKVAYSGFAELYKKTQKSFQLVFLLSIIVIYLVLCIQFESFFLPLIIMLTVPLALFGTFMSIWLTGGTVNLYTQIGMITLIGLITKHGILMVTLVQHGVEQGKELADSIYDAAKQRIRPILMTTAAMVLGTMPLVLASGLGSESRQQIGLAIVGGMVFGTAFTLLILPSLIHISYRAKAEIQHRISGFLGSHTFGKRV